MVSWEDSKGNRQTHSRAAGLLFRSLLNWSRCAACGALGLQPGIEPVPPSRGSVESQSLLHQGRPPELWFITAGRYKAAWASHRAQRARPRGDQARAPRSPPVEPHSDNTCDAPLPPTTGSPRRPGARGLTAGWPHGPALPGTSNPGSQKESRCSGLPRRLSSKASACQCRRRGLDPWVRNIPWRRAWQPTAYSCLESPVDR